MASGSSESHGTTASTPPPPTGDNDVEELVQGFGKCKWFNFTKGYGYITPHQEEGGTSAIVPDKDIFVHQKAIQMDGFRSLGEGELVKFWYQKSSKGYEAKKVCGPSGGNCHGSEKPKRKKRPDKCYNCGKEGHHAKQCIHPPQPKRCHCCESIHHLKANCPAKQESKGSDSRNSPKGDSPSALPTTSAA